MAYTEEEFSKELTEKIVKGYSPKEIGEWCFEIYSKHIRDLNSEMVDVIGTLFMMEEGSEFEFTHDELKEIAKMLMNEERNIIKTINERRGIL